MLCGVLFKVLFQVLFDSVSPFFAFLSYFFVGSLFDGIFLVFLLLRNTRNTGLTG